MRALVSQGSRMIALLVTALFLLPAESVQAVGCTWTGTTSTDWATVGNWSGCGGILPGNADDVEIPASVTNEPSIITADAAVRHLIIRTGRNLTMSSGRTLSISGNLNRDGTFTHGNGTVLFNGSGGQTISGTMIDSNAFYHVSISNGASVSTANAMEVAGDWTNNGSFAQSAATFEFSGNNAHAMLGNGTSQFNNFYTSGEIINAGASNIFIRGGWTHGTPGIFNADTSSVTFNGSDNQSQPGITDVPSLYNMTVNKSAGTMSTRKWTVDNNFLLTLGAIAFSGDSSFKNVTLDGGTFTAPNDRITVSGSWTRNGGTFTTGTGEVSFNGSSAQTIGGTIGTTFNSLRINNTNGVSLNQNATVNGTLALQGGDLNIGANILDLASGAAVTSSGGGDVVGSVRRNHVFNPDTIYTFNHLNTLLNFSSISTSGTLSITINLVKSAPPPSEIAKAVSRVYSISSSNITAFSANLQLRYKDTELQTGMSETALRAWRKQGDPLRWMLQPSIVNTTSNFVTASGVTGFSDWAITDNGAPTAVRLTGLSAQSAPSINGLIGLLGAMVIAGIVGYRRWRGK